MSPIREKLIVPVEAQRDRQRITRLLQIVLTVQALAFALTTLLTTQPYAQWISVIAFGISVAFAIAVRTKFFNAVRVLSPLLLLVVLSISVTISGVRIPAIAAYPFLIIMTTVVLGRLSSAIATVLAIAAVNVAWYLHRTGVVEPVTGVVPGPNDGWLIALIYAGTYAVLFAHSTFGREDMQLLADREDQISDALSEAKLQKAALADSEARYRLLAENMVDVIWVFGIDLTLHYCSPSIVEQQGHTPEELGRIPLDQQMPPESYTLLMEALAEELARDNEPEVDPDRTRTLEYEVICKDGSRKWVETVVSFLRDEAGNPERLLGVSRDISQRRRDQEANEMLQAQMLQLQKMESLGMLAGGVAHDFNNILLGIMGNADLALRKLPDDSDVRENIEQLVLSAGRAADLCNQLLAYSGKGRFETVRVNVSELVEETATLLSLPAGANVKMEYALDENLPAVQADPSQLRQVALNLILNARESIGEEKGAVKLSTGMYDANGGEVQRLEMPPETSDGPFVYMTVDDNGCGMDGQTRARVFDPFFTTKQRGHGLGMSAVLGIVKRHGGGLGITSKAGEGTRVTVCFPAATDSAGYSAPEHSNGSSAPLRGTILVVDDEEVVRTFARHALEHCGMTVLTAKNGREATELFERKPEGIDAVLLDLEMPVMNGFDALQAIRAIRADVPVVLSSGYDEEQAARNLAEEGHASFIHKPYRVQQLADAIRDLLN